MFAVDTHQEFVDTVWDHYRRNGRDLPWRREPLHAYDTLVSEVMLQQTQVARVIPKYHDFLVRFPTIRALARAPLAEVLTAWNGLGYNRRAKYLHEAAKQLVSKVRPWTIDDLTSCKGIGFNTAAAVVTYAYNQPVAFIETNVRSVYIYHFFPDQDQVADKQILELVEQSLLLIGEEQHRFAEGKSEFTSEGAMRNPEGVSHYREWYWALMDYGSFLKATVSNAARASKHYTKQSRFEGSRRQVRGHVLRVLAAATADIDMLKAEIPDERLLSVLAELESEGLIIQGKHGYQLPG